MSSTASAGGMKRAREEDTTDSSPRPPPPPRPEDGEGNEAASDNGDESYHGLFDDSDDEGDSRRSAISSSSSSGGWSLGPRSEASETESKVDEAKESSNVRHRKKVGAQEVSGVTEDEKEEEDDEAIAALFAYVAATAPPPAKVKGGINLTTTTTPLGKALPPPPSARLLTPQQSAAQAFLHATDHSASSSGGNASLHHPSSSRNTQLVTTLEHIKEELLRPLSSTSTELTVVDAADESAEVMDRLISHKMPSRPQEEVKKLRQLQYVDHTTISYIPLHKVFYVPAVEMQRKSPEELAKLLESLDGAKVRGSNPPAPIESWDGTGLADTLLDVMGKEGFERPFAVQSLAVPALMSGRDLILAAKTGSGKTLGYVLPLLRHCGHQPRCEAGEGPIALVLVPTQELAAQVCALLQKLCRVLRLRLVASNGCVSLSENIKAVKAGVDVMVATPGRLLDLLTVNNGTSMNLQRVSFVVVDEADRLFDSGFSEHVEAFLKNIRPDRQLAMVTATLPKELKKMMLKHMEDPVEISVGGLATPATNVDQRFYFFDADQEELDPMNWNALDVASGTSEGQEAPRLKKLLEILGEEAASGERLFLVFVQRKEEVDELLAKLTTYGYERRIATLYSGMDPIDRQFALEHFAPGNQFILLATGVAERGLDIPYLEMVINYSMPDHVEAYVHRIGRTGRAGRKGRAVSFFRRGVDDDLAPELAEALKRAGQATPEELVEVATRIRALRREGQAVFNVGFYRGYRKATHHRMAHREHQKALWDAAKAAGLEEYLSADDHSDDVDSDHDDDGEGKAGEGHIQMVSVSSHNAAGSLVVAPPGAPSNSSGTLTTRNGTAAAAMEARLAKAKDFAKQTTEVEATHSGTGDGGSTGRIRFQTEFPINDLPRVVRSAVQRSAELRKTAEETKTSIIKKGVFVDPQRRHAVKLKEGEQPLYLLIIGETHEAVRSAQRRLNAIKSEAMEHVKSKTSITGVVL